MADSFPPAPRVPVLILASRSPRRAHLLRDAGYTFKQLDPPFVDPAQPDHGVGDPQALAMELAAAKARSLASDTCRTERPISGVILGADTIVVAPDGSLLGQPIDRADAQRMLRMLLSHTHQVITGVSLLRLEAGRGNVTTDGEAEIEYLVDSASVTIADPGATELARYLASGDWRGKAGAYNLAELQGRSGTRGGWKIQVVGDPTTVIGLPMRRLTQALLRWGVKPRKDNSLATDEHR